MTDLPYQTGKLDFTEDKRDWRWSWFRGPLIKAGLVPTIPAPPWGHGNTYKDWHMLANGPDPSAPSLVRSTGVGCCVVSSAANETKVAKTDAGIAPTAADLFDGTTTVKDYSAAGGYNLQTGQGDNGLEIRSFLKYRQQTGIVDIHGNRHKIGPYVLGDPGNVQHMVEMLYFFEGCPLGLQIQLAQMEQFQKGEEHGTAPVWEWKAGSEGLGGHCIPAVGRPANEWWTAISWRLRLLLTQRFFGKSCEEMWGYLTPERVSAVTKKTYEHASEEQLEEYLNLVGHAA